MDVLLRTVRQGTRGTPDIIDASVTVDVVRVGSAADATIQLLGRDIAATHAVVERSAKGFRVVCRRGHRVTFKGALVSTAEVVGGDEIRVGGHSLTFRDPPAGFDTLIEIRPDPNVVGAEFEAAFLTDLDRTWMSKRSGSWVLAILVLVAFFAIPFALIGHHGTVVPVAVPSDALWTSGPLSAAHAHATGNDCGACHRQLFAHVRDQECTTCHKNIHEHVSPAHLALTQLGKPQRCGECHGEHDERAARLIVDDDRLCVGCHGAADRKFGSLKVDTASGFAPHEHPAFRVVLQRLAGSDSAGDAAGGPDRVMTAPDLAGAQWVFTSPRRLAGAREESNLKFSHAQHLDPAKVSSSSGAGGLGCSDCHHPSADGEHFQPISMQASCSSCHQLNFDPAAPDRQLPHGKPADAILLIEDYFARKFSDPLPVKAQKTQRRLPDLDRDPSRAGVVETCTGSSVQCARQRALAEIENQFTGRGCVSCHWVKDTRAADVHERFQVVPVRLATDYFPDVHFNHRVHQLQGKLTGDAACESCHAARKSSDAHDLLIPDVDNCLQCHRDRRSAGGVIPRTVQSPMLNGPDEQKVVSLQCISCHLYHPTAVLQTGRVSEKQ